MLLATDMCDHSAKGQHHWRRWMIPCAAAEEVHTATNTHVRPFASSLLTITTSVESSMCVVLEHLRSEMRV